MLTKKELEKLVKSREIEQVIAHEIKKDMSILAEVYAYPKEEYICISEYPIDDGKVDYLIMSGRSRMKIKLIEIKGADINFLNSSGTINSKINEGIQQLNGRFSFINKNYENFRRRLHINREQAEGGCLGHNYVLGNNNPLKVDPNKDVAITNTIVIGGRTVDDKKESAIRDDIERRTHYQMRVESWDSFIKKLSRT